MHIHRALFLPLTVAVWLVNVSCDPETAHGQQRELPKGIKLAYVRGDSIYVAEHGRRERLVSTTKKAAVNHTIHGFELSPDGRSILYVQGSGSRQRIAILDVATGAVRTLESVPSSNVHDVRWSPDGRWIAFRVVMPGAPKPARQPQPDPDEFVHIPGGTDPMAQESMRSDIGIVGRDDKGFRLVTGPDRKRPQLDWFGYPAWKFDGRSIFCTASMTMKTEFLEYDLDGKHRSTLDMALLAGQYAGRISVSSSRSFRFSPDGRYLIFTAMHRNPETTALTGGSSLYLFDLSSRTTRQITPDSLAVDDAAWLPGSTRIVFCGFERTEENLRIIRESSPESSTYRSDAPELVWDLYMVDVDGGRVGVVVPQGGRVVSASTR